MYQRYDMVEGRVVWVSPAHGWKRRLRMLISLLLLSLDDVDVVPVEDVTFVPSQSQASNPVTSIVQTAEVNQLLLEDSDCFAFPFFRASVA